MPKKITLGSSINEALIKAMKLDKKMICYGLGINDPKNIFGTTKNLEKLFGSHRVFDVPTSENALTGLSIGLALGGIKSVVTHQRLDFFLLAMDQLINSASKWYYMFGSKISVPITIRLIMGRGWGQGPTHSQNLQGMFSQIPGIKIVMPSKVQNSYDLLLSSIFDPNPVLYLEHRWLHNLEGTLSKSKKITKLKGSNIEKKGKDITVVTMSYGLTDVIDIAKKLKKFDDIDLEIIDLSVIKPLNLKPIYKSIKKTKKLLLLDTGFYTNSISSEILSEIIQKHNILDSNPVKLAMPDVPEPTSFGLTKNFYIKKKQIIKEIKKLLAIKRKLITENILEEPTYHDVPGTWFKGPF